MDERLRAYRFALDPTNTQLESMAQHAGAARWAFNHALGQKLEACAGGSSENQAVLV